jgi:hypothetical protein
VAKVVGLWHNARRGAFRISLAGGGLDAILVLPATLHGPSSDATAKHVSEDFGRDHELHLLVIRQSREKHTTKGDSTRDHGECLNLAACLPDSHLRYPH